MKPRKPIELPAGATAEQWERAFRRTESSFSRNLSRMWVLEILRSALQFEMKQK